MVRAADKKSPREAVEFVLQLLKYNDNNGNPYSDVFWLAALIKSVGELEIGQQSILLLLSLLKRIDHLLQFDRLMPSYDGILSVGCIRALTQVAPKLLGFVPLDCVFELVKPFRDIKAEWQVRAEASRALLDFEFHCKGIDAALQLSIKYLDEEMSFRGSCHYFPRECWKSHCFITRVHFHYCIYFLIAGQVKLAVHAMRLCRLEVNLILPTTSGAKLLWLCFVYLKARWLLIISFFVITYSASYKSLQEGEAESFREQKNIFAAFIPESKYVEPPSEAPNLSHGDLTVPETSSNGFAFPAASKDDLGAPEPTTDGFGAPELPSGGLGDPEPSIGGFGAPEPPIGSFDGLAVSEPSVVSPSNQNLEEVNTWHDLGSRMTASIGSAKLASDVDDRGKELQCTAVSSKVSALPRPEDLSPSRIQDNRDAEVQKYASLQALSVPRNDIIGGSAGLLDSLPRGKEKEKKKDEKRKRDGHKGHRDDPEYLERKRIKKVKKQKEKEMAKLLNERAKVPSAELPSPQLCNSNWSSPVDPTSW